MIFKKAARPVIMSRNGIVSSGHFLASLAGVKVLQEGGNAVDAALAAAFAMPVVKPDTCGPGGDLFALVYMKKTGKVEALNASGPAPKSATIDWFREKKLDAIPTSGPLSVAIPGAVDGWLELHRKYGTIELARLIADGVRLGREGFPIHQDLAERVAEFSSSFPWIERCFRKPLGDLRPGRVLLQRGLADVLERIAQTGREGFYGGEIAAKISDSLRAEGGLLTEEDLEGNFAEWLEPLSTEYRGYTVFEQPPVSQGFMVLEMLNIVEAWPLNRREFGRADAVHYQVGAKKLAFEDRIRHLEDPRFGDPQVVLLISKEHAARRRERLQEIFGAAVAVGGGVGGDTTYLCAADKEGNAVSLIQSIFAPFGSRFVAGETGVIMNNRLCSFGLDPNQANALKPGKRPAHTLNSYMVLKDSEFFAVGGSPGADDQPQTNLQILHNILDLEMDPQSAVEEPRWSHQPGTPPRDRLPEELRVEEGFDPRVAEELRRRGHKVSVAERWSFGSAKLIVREPAAAIWMAGADPRREGYALGL